MSVLLWYDGHRMLRKYRCIRSTGKRGLYMGLYRRNCPKQLLAILLAVCLLFGCLPVFAASSGVDLTASAVVTENFKTNRKSVYSEVCHIAAWSDPYSLFDVGAGAYLLYRITVPAGEAATATVDYKDWTGVGNGGVHQYSGAPKIRWYVSDTDPGKSFGGNTAGWTEIAPNESVSLQTYTYTYALSDAEDTERTVYACMKFSDNDAKYSGRAGWNDGAWVDKITFAAGDGEESGGESGGEDAPAAPTGPVVDLTEYLSVSEALKSTHKATLALAETGRWVDAYALYDLGLGQYLLYRIDIPANDGAQVVVDYKAWTDVGNGGVHQYSSQPKTEWYVTESNPGAAFDGDVKGWTKVTPDEDISLDTYTYSYTLAEKEEGAPARTVYACIRFISNANQYHGMAGGNDGSWIDGITFNRLVSKQTPVEGISLDPAQLTLAFGKTAALKPVFQPVDATVREITWSSSDPTVVTVEKGTVRAVGVGQATITATTTDGGFTASCLVSVPDDMNEIVLESGKTVDTKILEKGDDDNTPPLVWYHDAGTRQNATAVVNWTNVTFRDFGANAYSIYKIKVPGGSNARILLRFVTNYTDANGTWSGVVSSGKPRLNVYYTSDPITLSTMEDAVWIRADSDGVWSATKAEYALTVSSMSSEDRYVYVKVYSTDVDAQGAWITSLGFDTIVPTPELMFIKPPSRTLYDAGDRLDLAGLIVGVRYSDGSEAILSPKDYVVQHDGALQVSDTEIQIATADGVLSGSFGVTVIESIDLPGTSGNRALGWIAGIGAAVLALVGGAAAALVLRRKKKQ